MIWKPKFKFMPVALSLLVVIVLVVAFGLSASYAPEVLAQDTSVNGGGFVPCGNKAGEPCNVSHLFRTVELIINYLISVVGLVALLVLVIAGVRMIISRGESQYTQAKKQLQYALLGLGLVLLAFVIVNTILAGSFNIGIRDGAKMLTNPSEYIRNAQ